MRFAKERYAALGVNTDKAIETLEKLPSRSIAGRPTTLWASSAT